MAVSGPGAFVEGLGGKRIEDFDAAIAAHALAEDAVLVTADIEDMARIPGLEIEDWAKPARR